MLLDYLHRGGQLRTTPRRISAPADDERQELDRPNIAISCQPKGSLTLLLRKNLQPFRISEQTKERYNTPEILAGSQEEREQRSRRTIADRSSSSACKGRKSIVLAGEARSRGRDLFLAPTHLALSGRMTRRFMLERHDKRLARYFKSALSWDIACEL